MLSNEAKADTAIGDVGNYGINTNQLGSTPAINDKYQLYSTTYVGPFGDKVYKCTSRTDIGWFAALQLQLATI